MFGEYGLYCAGQMFRMICDGQFLIKPAAGGGALRSDLAEASPYARAKPNLLVDPDRWDNGDWLAELVRVRITELQAPKPKVSQSKPAERLTAAEPLRSLTSIIVLTPTDGGLEIDVQGDLAGILTIASNAKSPAVLRAGLSEVEMVAGTGFEPVTFRL